MWYHSKVNRWEYLPIPFIYLQSTKLPPQKKDRTKIPKTSLCLAVLHSPYLLSFPLHRLVELLVLVFNPLEFRVLFTFLSPPDPPLLSPPVPPFHLHKNHRSSTTIISISSPLHSKHPPIQTWSSLKFSMRCDLISISEFLNSKKKCVCACSLVQVQFLYP